MSILFRATPDEVKFILVDPKKIELSIYQALEPYHLITSEDVDEYVITNAQNAIYALRSAVVEMEERYDILLKNKVRDISEYNAKIKHRGEALMPYIVVVIDELADLMVNSAGRTEIEQPIQRLAQKARAVGIHLVVATQRPSVDVITGVIRSNFPARIAFNVATKTDSRTILDVNGAEKLLGRGDMLYLPPGRSDPLRLHNAYISLEEIENVLEHICRQPKKEDDYVLPTAIEEEEEDEFDPFNNGDRDSLFNEAMQLVIAHQQGSASLLQRRLKVGYSRAGRLIDQLEEARIVGPPMGSKPREVLVGPEYYEDEASDQN
ncbi:MAG: FtsK/SpoIIIE domain-containing protein [Candidatus Marinimicrobia bacterium]|nr:FtsK/SpoIIIE domain-containing protein [Candidatus Neomarinimicrobiota bacterium]